MTVRKHVFSDLLQTTVAKARRLGNWGSHELWKKYFILMRTPHTTIHTFEYSIKYYNINKIMEIHVHCITASRSWEIFIKFYKIVQTQTHAQLIKTPPFIGASRFHAHLGIYEPWVEHE